MRLWGPTQDAQLAPVTSLPVLLSSSGAGDGVTCGMAVEADHGHYVQLSWCSSKCHVSQAWEEVRWSR